MFEQLDKLVKEREKIQESKDLFYDTEEHKQYYEICKDMSFYCWQFMLENSEDIHDALAKRTHNRCCFNRFIGLPQKHGKTHPLYRYEYDIYNQLMKDKPSNTDNIVARQQHKHLAVVKATGLGVTELVLRWIAWMCLRNDDLKGKRVCIITGNNIALAVDLIRRLKALFLNPDSTDQLVFESKETVLELNGCLIQAFPSHHLSAARGLSNVSIVFLDEASFFEINQADEARDVAERYIAKSDPYIIMVSTPNKPSDLLHKITEQKEDECIYKRLYLPYNVGLGNIFTQQEIEIAKRSMSFEREYNLKFLGLIGNVFLDQKIDQAIKLGQVMVTYRQVLEHPEYMPLTRFYIGIDVGFGSSAFAIVLVSVMDDKICVLETLELNRQEFNDCIEKVSEVMIKYNLSTNNTKILVDASAPSVIAAIKSNLNEQTNYLQLLAYRKKNKVNDPYYDMVVIPVPFTTDTKKQLLMNLKELVDDNCVAIDLQRHGNLVLALRTAKATDMILDKNATTSDDVLDAMTLAVKRISINREYGKI